MTKNIKVWKQVIYKTGIWLGIEIWLNIIGLDDLADYSEFIFAQDLALDKKNRRTVQIMEYPPQFCPQIEDFCPLPGTITKLTDIHEKYKSQLKILTNKCQHLEEPCIKFICITTSSFTHPTDSQQTTNCTGERPFAPSNY